MIYRLTTINKEVVFVTETIYDDICLFVYMFGIFAREKIVVGELVVGFFPSFNGWKS